MAMVGEGRIWLKRWWVVQVDVTIRESAMHNGNRGNVRAGDRGLEQSAYKLQ